MPVGKNLFTSQTITTSTAAPIVAVPVGDVDFIAVGVTVTAVSGTNPQAIFQVQWSFDGSTWTDPGADPGDVIATMTATGCRVKRIPVKAPYWRLGAVVSGTNPSFTVTGNALIW
jgi:hypothetical protein